MRKTSKEKAQIVLEAITSSKAISEIAEQHSVGVASLHKWKKIVEENLYMLFENGLISGGSEDNELLKRIDDLTKIIGELSIENRILKK